MYQCGCGGQVLESNHILKTKMKAAEWMPEGFKEEMLPLNIEQHTCRGCGKAGHIVYEKGGEIVYRRGA